MNPNNFQHTTCYYRLPYTKEIMVVRPRWCARLTSLDELRGRCGFVMMPFDIDGRHDILLYEGYEVEKVAVPDVVTAEVKYNLNDLDKNSYEDAFVTFKEELTKRELSKLVLSRKETLAIKLTEEDILNVFYSACRKYPRMMIYLLTDEGGVTWMGCTPEILIDGAKSHYRTVALAGTMSSSSGESWSEKNRMEQRIVADYVRSCVQPLSEVLEEEGPYTSKAGHLIHLKTEFHLTPREGIGVVDLISTLHPTPAVCGFPKEKSQRFIIEKEGYDREYYAGIVGWLDDSTQDGETHLYVNLRCGKISSNKITLFAGGGILPESELESEWQETESKMNTILSLFQ